MRFIIRNDHRKRIRFTGLNSEYAIRLLQKYKKKEFSSVAFQKEDKLFLKSTAVLHIFKLLDSLWPVVFYIFIIVPAPIRDFVYDFISERREKWFGRSAECEVCKTENHDLFIF